MSVKLLSALHILMYQLLWEPTGEGKYEATIVYIFFNSDTTFRQFLNKDGRHMYPSMIDVITFIDFVIYWKQLVRSDFPTMCCLRNLIAPVI